MGRRASTTLMLVPALALANAAAAENPRERPEIFGKLLECRTVADNSQRLACYDQSVGALAEAERKRDVVVVDRKEIRETRKSLFGFTLPRIGLLAGEADGDKDEISEISSTVETARMIRGGDWSLRLAGQAGTWETNSEVRVPLRAGDKVRIRKASLGSYLGQVGPNRGVRFRRVE